MADVLTFEMRHQQCLRQDPEVLCCTKYLKNMELLL
jgi:hypothetical protein